MNDPALAPVGAQNNYNKLIAGSTASGLAGAVTTVVMSIIAGAWPTYVMAPSLQGAIQTLVTVAVTAAAIYITPHERTSP
jgi:hypothetical protein